MARPKKQIIDYFPHYSDASDGKTMYILDNRFGNDGFAFWFRLLELLCRTPGQNYNYNESSSWQYLVVRTRVKEEMAKDILKALADAGAIDKELYNHQIIWSQNLVNNLVDVYKRRACELPIKPVIDNHNGVSVNNNPEIVNNKPVSRHKVKESKVNKSIKESIEKNPPIISPDKKGVPENRTTTEAEFLEYVEETKKEFPDLNCEVEFGKFKLWWSEGKRHLTRPKTAWHNWLLKAREIQKEKGGVRGGNQGNTQKDSAVIQRGTTDEDLLRAARWAAEAQM